MRVYNNSQKKLIIKMMIIIILIKDTNGEIIREECHLQYNNQFHYPLDNQRVIHYTNNNNY